MIFIWGVPFLSESKKKGEEWWLSKFVCSKSSVAGFGSFQPSALPQIAFCSSDPCTVCPLRRLYERSPPRNVCLWGRPRRWVKVHPGPAALHQGPWADAPKSAVSRSSAAFPGRVSASEGEVCTLGDMGLVLGTFTPEIWVAVVYSCPWPPWTTLDCRVEGSQICSLKVSVVLCALERPSTPAKIWVTAVCRPPDQPGPQWPLLLSPPQDISHICLGDADVTGVVVNAFKMILRSKFRLWWSK